ncbi:MAG: DUF2058 domain-containing protein [Thiohalomonadales bacterium]
MGNSFQDQLFRAGLVNKQQLNQSKNSKHKQKKKQQNKKNNGAQSTDSHPPADVQRIEDLESNRILQAEREKKALASEIKQLIEQNCLNLEDSDLPYKFPDQGKIRQLYVTTRVREGLANDTLQIVRIQQNYAVVSSAVILKILQRDVDYPVIKNSPEQVEDENYADYTVPDDLIW